MRPGVPLSPEETARRAPLWAALSDLFLDTEMQDAHYRGIRDAALAGGFDPVEVKTILTDEVAPVVGSNLLVVAGEWALFDPDWVVTRVQDHLSGRPVSGVIAGPMLRTVQRMVLSHEWPRLERILNGESIDTAMAARLQSSGNGVPRLFWWGVAIILIAVFVWILLE